MKHVGYWLGWWLGLFWLWLLLTGAWNAELVVAAALSAAVAATVAEVARTRLGFSAPLPLRLLLALPPALGMVVVDFGILSVALLRSVARRQVVRGRLVERELPSESWITSGVGSRAWTVLFASYSPNAFVVDVDPGARRVVFHDLVPNRKSEEPA
jgi:hypothetical protein